MEAMQRAVACVTQGRVKTLRSSVTALCLVPTSLAIVHAAATPLRNVQQALPAAGVSSTQKTHVDQASAFQSVAITARPVAIHA